MESVIAAQGIWPVTAGRRQVTAGRRQVTAGRTTRPTPRHGAVVGGAGLPLVLALASALLAGCAGSGSGGGGGATGQATAPSGAAGSPPSAVSQTHWQTALQALGQTTQSPAPTFERQGLAQWSALLANAWPALKGMVQRELQTRLQQQLQGFTQGSIGVVGIRSVLVDVDAPPALSSVRPDEVALELPASPATWRIEVQLALQATAQPNLFGLNVPLTFVADAGVRVDDLRVLLPVRYDLQTVGAPALSGVGTPLIDFRLSVVSQSTFLSPLLQTVSQVLDPVIRVALQGGVLYLQQQLGVMAQNVGAVTAYGLGGPGVQPVPQTRDLFRFSEEVSASIQRDHTPFGTIVSTEFDQPGYGNGVPVRYRGFGDSAIWTGTALCAEAMRYDLTRSAASLAAVQKLFDGMGKCVDVEATDGLLGRCVVPVSSPHLSSIIGGLDYHTGTINGVSYGSEGNISRDQYLGAFLGFSQSYLRVPALRARAADYLSRMVGYLESHDWIAYQTDGVTPARGLFAQTPAVTWAAIKTANLVDRGRWGALHDRNQDLIYIAWWPAWTSGLEAMASYYKFNLGAETAAIIASTETDPARYRGLVQVMDVDRATIGHHLNAWFDAVYGMIVPAQAPLIAPRVEAELQHFAARDRRSRPVDLRGDPLVQSVQYSSGMLGTGQFGSAFTGQQTITVARYPVPIAKRPYSDFIWQRNPFDLNGGGSPNVEEPSVDMIAPYWMGRAYGMLR